MTEWVDDHFIAGDVALDFANTVYRHRPEPGADLLVATADLAGWFVRAGLLAGGESGVRTGILNEARALRELLWIAFDAQQDGRRIPADSISGLLDIARRSAADVDVHADGRTGARTARGALGVVALAAVALLLEPPSQHVRACDRCGWFFIDSSRGRRRRWCSMRTCGNQAKAARYRSAHA